MLNLDKNKKYLLACSYGPDSMALFDMLLKENYRFEVAHVNYHLREESDAEEKALSAYCADHNTLIHIKNVSLKIKNNIEAKCRDIRYSFFCDLYFKNDFSGLIVAHNEDDHIETYFLQKQRQNLVKHYGISEFNHLLGMDVYRPLLGFTKQELLVYCENNNVPFAIDKTNLEPVFERNKIRIGVVSKMNRQERDEIIAEIDQKNDQVHNIIEKVRKVGSSIERINELSDVELAYYLDGIINNNEYNFAVTYNLVKEVRKMFDSKKPNIIINFNRNKCQLVKDYDSLHFQPTPKTDGYEFEMSKPSVIDNKFFFADFTGDTSNRNITALDYPITIRTFRKGDKYVIKDYQVLVRRLFIDWKMPTHLRQRWPIITNKNGKIIYIPRYRKEFKPEASCNFYVKECFTLK